MWECNLYVVLVTETRKYCRSRSEYGVYEMSVLSLTRINIFSSCFPTLVSIRSALFTCFIEKFFGVLPTTPHACKLSPSRKQREKMFPSPMERNQLKTSFHTSSIGCGRKHGSKRIGRCAKKFVSGASSQPTRSEIPTPGVRYSGRGKTKKYL
ncbi:hypothetical protein P167DRAFT_316861 [Morchella conica CCBAS932]|uniref:Uncharacterized protein n=1 Tax=Morchella conica CCBAS932 TaxID=1392247 RepID=A0A3N4L0R2_9PEZI|nr:hypothetical protein P167DRAFT_316861 [Morchella conica CCBAS932]